MKIRFRLIATIVILAGALLIWLALRPAPAPPLEPALTPLPSSTASLSAVPTATQFGRATAPAPAPSPVPSPAPLPTPGASPSPLPTASPSPVLTLGTAQGIAVAPAARFGAAGGLPDIVDAVVAGLPLGSYLDWYARPDPPAAGGANHWQMIRVSEQGFNISFADLALIIAARPGAIWIIGNEPDVIVQDNTTPETYAVRYHDAYAFIRSEDPTAQIAIAGVAQPTPLRLAYLDRVLDHYQATYGEPMPIDIWTMHAFILREEAGSWGAGIPPGMDVTTGTLYEIVDHDDLAIWRTNLLDFRRWLAGRGYQDRPVAITEYGILMPNDYGFPPENVIAFLENTVTWMLETTDPAGYPPENGRLIQWWFWFSVYDPGFPTSDLFSPRTKQLTPLGAAYAALIP